MIKVYFADTAGVPMGEPVESATPLTDFKSLESLVREALKKTMYFKESRYCRYWTNPSNNKIVICDFGSYTRYLFIESNEPIDLAAIMSARRESSNE